MTEVPRFYTDHNQWTSIGKQLKLMPCPHCQRVGTLNQHGTLYGYDAAAKKKTVRAQRLLCSNRHRRPGCGRTWSVWLADKFRRVSISADLLWKFLNGVVHTGIREALRRVAEYPLQERTWRRIWNRFNNAKCQLRTTLWACCSPPDDVAPAATHRPAAHVLAHVQTAFPKAQCPITSFQQTLQTFFL